MPWEIESEIGINGNLYKEAFNAAKIPLVVIEEDMTISLVNHRFELLSGFYKDEVEGKISIKRQD